jgi:hypothetical protein
VVGCLVIELAAIREVISFDVYGRSKWPVSDAMTTYPRTAGVVVSNGRNFIAQSKVPCPHLQMPTTELDWKLQDALGMSNDTAAAVYRCPRSP